MSADARSCPTFPGVDEVPYLTNTTFLELDALPGTSSSLAEATSASSSRRCTGGSAAEVTVVEKAPRLVSREDEDVSDAIREILEAEGIDRPPRVRMHPLRAARRGHRGRRQLRDRRTRGRRLHVLLAVGRRPNTDDLGLEAAGVEVDAHGYIVVDDSLRTNVPGIWALGDCNGRGAFTHTAYNDFEIVAANLLDGEHAQA